MEQRIRALLVGVATYANERVELVGNKKTKVNKSMPSAARDVAAIGQLVKGLGFPRVECRTRIAPKETSHRAILRDLDWLFAGDDEGFPDQVLFYFSGHGGRAVNSAEMNSTTYNQEVLCPSDTDWKNVFIRDLDLMSRAEHALHGGACVEIILETCSAAGIATVSPLRPFGGFFDSGAFPAGAGAVWCASGAEENSHSGPVPCCSPVPEVGLFTHYFCEGIKQTKSRGALLDYTTAKLKNYFSESMEEGCCTGLGPQTPRLIATDEVEEGRPLSASCPVKW